MFFPVLPRRHFFSIFSSSEMPFYRFLIFNLPSARSSANAESLLFGIIRLRINEAMRIAEKCKHFCLSIIAFSIYLLRFLFRCMTQAQINSTETT